MSSKRTLKKNARALAQKFFGDAQALFDDEGMTDDLYEGEVFSALLSAQQYAEDVVNAEDES